MLHSVSLRIQISNQCLSVLIGGVPFIYTSTMAIIHDLYKAFNAECHMIQNGNDFRLKV